MTPSNVAFRRLAAAALAIGGLAACSQDDGPTTTTQPELAYVRVINAIPDTGAMIYGFRDQVEAPIEASGLNFRQASSYKGTAVGQRQLRAFIVSNSPAVVAGAPILDRTLTLRANQYYTILHVGLAQGDRDSVIVIEDNWPRATELGTQIAVRAIHAVPSGVGPVNVFTTRLASQALPATPAFTNVAYGAATAYARVAADSIAGHVQPTAAPATVLSRQAPAGTAGTDQVNPEGGSRVAGTSLSAVAFPAGIGARATATTANPQFSGVPSVLWFVDGLPAETVTRLRP